MGKFVKGQSGNPGGKPKGYGGLVAAARAHTEEAVRTLVESLRDPKLRVQAAVALLDRGWGRPPQTIQGDPENPLTVIGMLQWRPPSDT